jgi:hypothetical protein
MYFESQAEDAAWLEHKQQWVDLTAQLISLKDRSYPVVGA